jgi:hypothetical protein
MSSLKLLGKLMHSPLVPVNTPQLPVNPASVQTKLWK